MRYCCSLSSAESTTWAYRTLLASTLLLRLGLLLLPKLGTLVAAMPELLEVVALDVGEVFTYRLNDYLTTRNQLGVGGTGKAVNCHICRC